MLFEQYGEDAEKIIENNNTNPKTTVRINTVKTDKERIISSLTENGVGVANTIEDDIIEISSFGDISKLSEYKEGFITPQGLSSYMAALAVNPKKDEIILDLCSAPGGKTTAMAELSNDKGKIYAFDLFEHKIELINNNCKRLGLNSVKAKAHDATVIMEEYVGKADKILADVPCSGLGIIRKKPDIKWNKESSDFDTLIDIQKKILENCDKYLKQGGTLVYSTCTINKNENENIVLKFAKDYNYNIDIIKTYLPDDRYDGFFICKMIKE